MKILAFWNAHTKIGMSGGDKRFIEIFERFSYDDLTIITSPIGKSIGVQHGLRARYVVVTSEDAALGTTRQVVWAYAKRMLSASLFVLLHVNKDDYDVVYSASDILTDVLPPFVLKLKVPTRPWIAVVYHLVPNPRHRLNTNKIANLLSFASQRLGLWLTRHRADASAVLNGYVRDQLVEMGFAADTVYATGTAIDHARLNVVVAQPHLGYHCVFLGRLHPSKGIFDLIEIWRHVVVQCPEATLAIIGGGSPDIVNDLQRRVDQNDLAKSVDIKGYLADAEAFAIIKSSQVFVFPSHEEGFGMAILEAMGCGRPVVAWDLPVYAQIFAGGLVTVPEGDTRSCAEAIVRLIQNDALRQKTAQDALDCASQYTWEAVCARERALLATTATLCQATV